MKAMDLAKKYKAIGSHPVIGNYSGMQQDFNLGSQLSAINAIHFRRAEEGREVHAKHANK